MPVDVATVMAQKAERSVWEGVYSENQAARGRETYRRSCGACHAADLTGSEGPSLRGGSFFGRWERQTVGEMLLTIETSMPLGMPGSLDPRDYIDIVAFILKENGLPARSGGLPPDPEQLNSFLITAQPPKQ